MKTYFLVYTNDDERSSSIKYIAETKEQAEEYLFADYSGWYMPKGSGTIEEVDYCMNTLKRWGYHECECTEYCNYKTKEWKYLDVIDGQWKDYRDLLESRKNFN